jgi:hypothetical protein
MDQNCSGLVFAILTCSIFLSLGLTSILVKKTGLLAIPAGVFLIYFWSLHGAWFITLDEMGSDTNLNYLYLFDKLFPIRIDRNYVWAVGFYAVFLISVQLGLLYWLRNVNVRSVAFQEHERIVLDHTKTLLLTSGAFLTSYLIFRGDLASADDAGVSAYVISRVNPGDFFTLASILNRMTALPLGIGLAVLISGTNATRIISLRRRRWHLPAYLVLIMAFFIFTSRLGNKNELLVGLVGGSLFYLANIRHPNYFKLSLLSLTGLVCISAIDILRGIPFRDWIDAIGVDMVIGAVQIPLQSNEMFGAHLSMYGALTYEVPIKFGYSMYSLVCSVIPRIFWPSRPYDIYFHYADSVKASEGQGYTIHHATGWYLNFGLPGIVLGALFLSYLWSWLITRFCTPRLRERKLQSFFYLIAPWTFVGGFPVILRGGPEAYKGLVIDCFLAPLLVLFFALSRQARSHKPSVCVEQDIRRTPII